MRVLDRSIRMPAILCVVLAVALAGACVDTTAPRLGTIKMSVLTTGGDMDDEYNVFIAEHQIPVRATASFIVVLDAARYSVELKGVAGNCSVRGDNPRSIELPGGDTVEVAFEIECAATGVEIRTVTTGSDLPAEHSVIVDERPPVGVVANGAQVISRLQPGAHTVALNLLGTNCTHAGPATVSVNIANRLLTRIDFEVSCNPAVRSERIAFVSDSTGSAAGTTSFWIMLVNPDGSGQSAMRPGHSPSWSPDGKRLAYSITACDWYYGCYGGLVLIDPETGSSVTVARNYAPTEAAWSPTGDVIAFVNMNTDSLYTVAPAGGDLRHIAVPGVLRIRNPSWSPDGKLIAAECMIEVGNYDVCVFDRDGKNMARLTTSSGNDVEPAWSPDGGRIAYTRIPRGATAGQVALMAQDGTAAVTLTDGSAPAWSRDGTRLIFSRGDGLFTANVDGSSIERLTSGRHSDPAWRPLQ